MPRTIRTAIATLAVLGLLAAACGGRGQGTPTASKLETKFDITPRANALIIDEAQADDRLVSADPVAGEYRFKGSPDEINSPQIGQPIVIGGSGFGIVSAVSQQGGETLVEVTPATLGDIIDSGTMAWDYDVSWSDFNITYDDSAAMSGPVLAVLAPVFAQTSRKTTVEFTHQGWKFTLDLEPNDDRLDFSLVGSLTLPGNTQAQASVSGTGWVSGFNYTTNLEYAGGNPVDMTTGINGLQGEVELKWAAFRSPSQAIVDIVKLKAPLSLPIPMPGPFGIPMALQLKVAARIVPELSAPESSSGGSWKVKYSSDQAFSVDGNGGLPQGVLRSDEIDTSGDTVTAGYGPTGFGLGVEFPRFELGFVGQDPFAYITIDTYSTSLWTPGTTLTADIPPCQYGYTKLSAVAGYQLKVLGWASLTDQVTLWEKQVDRYLNGKECTLTGS